MTIPNLVEKCVSNMQEVISRGANTLIITNQNLPNSNFNYVINIPETNPLISPISFCYTYAIISILYF